MSSPHFPPGIVERGKMVRATLSRPRAVVLLSSEPRAVSEKVNICKLMIQRRRDWDRGSLYLMASFLTPRACSDILWLKRKKETARSLKSLIQKLETAHISRLVPRKENSSLFGKKNDEYYQFISLQIQRSKNPHKGNCSVRTNRDEIWANRHHT